ncbi:sorting nexin-21 isoform X1 [Ixodes scapularis]
MSTEELNSSLSDDLDEFRCSQVGGTLCFSEPVVDAEECLVSSTSRTIRSWSKTSQPSSLMASAGDTPPRVGPQQVVFEIVSAKTVVEGRKKFVCYTVLVKKSPGLERLPGVLERRYSDFLALFVGLRRRHPSCPLRDFPFPRKALLGNFTAEVITERSLAFRRLLARVHATPELRRSTEFADFTWGREVRRAHRLMAAGQFEDAAVLLENAYSVQEKILGDGDRDTFVTLAILTACLNAVDNVAEAQKYAEIALGKRVVQSWGGGERERSELEVPLLVLAIRLWWAVGKEKRDLEARLKEVKDSGFNVDALPTLLELVLKKDNASFYS